MGDTNKHKSSFIMVIQEDQFLFLERNVG